MSQAEKKEAKPEVVPNAVKQPEREEEESSRTEPRFRRTRPAPEPEEKPRRRKLKLYAVGAIVVIASLFGIYALTGGSAGEPEREEIPQKTFMGSVMQEADRRREAEKSRRNFSNWKVKDERHVGKNRLQVFVDNMFEAIKGMSN